MFMETIPPPAPDRALVDAMRAMMSLKPDQICLAVEAMIEHLDAIDRPANPDEPDFRCRKMRHSDGFPGDPGDEEDDGTGADTSWTEWHTRRPQHRRRRDVAEGYGPQIDEDAEATGDEEDHNGSEEDFIRHFGLGAGCPISDPGGGDNGGEEIDIRPISTREQLREQRDRIRETKCARIDRGFTALQRYSWCILDEGHLWEVQDALSRRRRRP